MEFKFSIRDDINVRSKSLVDLQFKDYSKEDIARAVAFYLDLILNSKHDKIAVGFGNVSLLSVAFMLALHKSGKEYILVYHNGNFNYHDYGHLYSNLFLTGVFSKRDYDIVIENSPNTTFTDTAIFEQQAFSFYKSDDLIFDYSKNKNVYIINSDSVQLLYDSEKIEGSSIQAAMNNYFVDYDYVVLMRPLQHVGVGTLSIYPSFFKVKNISLCPWIEDWESEYHKATHIHIDPRMMSYGCKLPKKLRMLTSGGYNFNSDCVNYVTAQSDIENIIDCYGTAKFPPPLAIRKPLIDSMFVWINEFIKPSIVKDTKQLILTSIDNTVKNITNDLIELDEHGFRLIGKALDEIRMSHKLHPVEEFKKLFSEYSGIVDFEVKFEFENGTHNPVVFVNEKDHDRANDIFFKYNIETKLIKK